MMLHLRVLGPCIIVMVLQICRVAVGSNEKGKRFLEKNKIREGVITLNSGLQYKVLKKGTGKYHPAPETPCVVHYAGTTPSLTPDAINRDVSQWDEFDSSYKKGEPVTYAPNNVITGWKDVLQMMVEGDHWEVYIPSELGYGVAGSGAKIKGGDVLIFRIELLIINGRAFPKKKICSLKARDDCEPHDIELLDMWKDKSVVEIEKGLKSFKNKAKFENNAKARTQILADVNLLNGMLKYKKKKTEL